MPAIINHKYKLSCNGRERAREGALFGQTLSVERRIQCVWVPLLKNAQAPLVKSLEGMLGHLERQRNHICMLHWMGVQHEQVQRSKAGLMDG